MCMYCQTIQPVNKYCNKCKRKLGRYYCDKCILWDDQTNKRIYHCDNCKICHVGKGLGIDYFRCEKKCNYCVPIKLKDSHKCEFQCKECNFESGFCDLLCRSCDIKYFQQNFKNWTSGNHNIDEFIQNSQLNAIENNEILEWIEYDRFEDIKYLAKGGFGTTYKAIWKDGPMDVRSWDFENNQWKRLSTESIPVVLKCLHDSQNITIKFLQDVRHFQFSIYND
jgi:hypothetical protein